MGFPSTKVAELTKKNVIGYGQLPRHPNKMDRLLGAMRKLPHPRGSSNSFAHESHRQEVGEVWLGDFIPVEDSPYAESVICFKERRTAYLRNHMLKSKSKDFWVYARSLVTFVKTALGVKMRILLFDGDPIVYNTHSGGLGNPNTVEAQRFEDETGVLIRRSPKGAHNLDAENSVGAIRAYAAIALNYMHMSSKMLPFALAYAGPILNSRSQPGSRRPL